MVVKMYPEELKKKKKKKKKKKSHVVICSKIYDKQNSDIFSISSPAPGQPMPCLLYVVRPYLTFHIFDISSRIVSWIELKLGGRNWGYMEIQNN